MRVTITKVIDGRMAAADSRGLVIHSGIFLVDCGSCELSLWICNIQLSIAHHMTTSGRWHFEEYVAHNEYC